jgi:glycogen(starch) synthase
VEFAGFVPEPEMAALAAAADCAVVPSIYEPFGLVALEAAAAGTPLVVADVGGLREFVEHGTTGLRFAAGDVAGLADAVSALLSDEVLARRLARAARAVLAERYSWSSIAGRTIDCYQAAARQERALRAGQVTLPPQRLQVPDGNLLTGSS